MGIPFLVPRDRHTASTPRFELTSRLDERSLEVALSGDLDMTATFKLEPTLERLLADKDVRRLTLDLQDVRFIDSTGLGALLAIRERTRQLEVEMRLVNLSDPVRRLLAMTGTASVFRD